jgi:hypothetical protein
MPRAHDIFISYAHLDNEPLVEGERGWISSFHYVLERRLAMLLGEQPRLWRDRELKGNDVFDAKIAEGLRSAALFVSVITPRYLKSDYCQKELAEFSRAAEGLEPRDCSRIFKVVKTPINLKDLPQQLQAVLGYEFYEVEPERNRIREFRLQSDYHQQFVTVIDDLAQEIASLLHRMEERETSGEGGAAPIQGAAAPAGGKRVYLAPTTTDQREAHDRVRRELLERGHTLLPNVQLPLVHQPFVDMARDYLEQADLAIHILGSKYGFIPEDASRSSIQLQIDCATEQGALRGLRRIFWLPPGLDVEDARQLELIEHVQSDEATLRGAQLLCTGIEELKEAVLAQLEPRPAAAAAAAANGAGEDGPPWIYLLYTPEDRDDVAEVEDALWDAGFEVRTPLFGAEDETEAREDHAENLRLCDAFLVYYGHGSERWQHKALSDLKKAPGLGRTKPILAKTVYLAPPASPAKQRFRTHEAAVLRPADGFSPDVLRPLLDEVRGRTGERTG